MTDRVVIAAAAAAIVMALVAPSVPLGAAVLFVALALAARRPMLLAVAVAVLIGARAHQSVEALEAPLPSRVDGRGELVSDPETRLFGVQAIVRVDGRRYVADVPTELASQFRTMLTGERVELSGRPRPLRGAPKSWVRSRHLAGRLAVSEIRPLPDVAPWFRVANGLHRTVTAGASSLGPELEPLYNGLVLGDDRGQSELMQFRFEASGLTHLLAVSGQNVAFVLALAAPLFRRVGRRSTVLIGGLLLVVFVLVTRAEPSVLRAAVMACIALVAVSAGRVAPGQRILASTVVILLVVDPLLAESVGFQLSVAATAGLLVLTRPIAERLPGPPWFTTPLAVTLAAQIATAPFLLALTGGLPSVAVLANLLAGPAAGLVMMLGVTVGLLAGMVRHSSAAVLQVPSGLLVRWVDGVATVSAGLPLPVLGPWRLAALAGSVAAVAVMRRWRAGERVGPVRAPRRAAHFATVVAVGLGVWALWPMGPEVGRRQLTDGAELWVGTCGATVVVVDDVTDVGGLLEAVWRSGVQRIDILVTGAGRRSGAAATAVAEQFEVVRQVSVGQRAPPGFEPLGNRQLSVGDLTLTGALDADDRSVATVEVSGRSCSLTP